MVGAVEVVVVHLGEQGAGGRAAQDPERAPERPLGGNAEHLRVRGQAGPPEVEGLEPGSVEAENEFLFRVGLPGGLGKRPVEVLRAPGGEQDGDAGERRGSPESGAGPTGMEAERRAPEGRRVEFAPAVLESGGVGTQPAVEARVEPGPEFGALVRGVHQDSRGGQAGEERGAPVGVRVEPGGVPHMVEPAQMPEAGAGHLPDGAEGPGGGRQEARRAERPDPAVVRPGPADRVVAAEVERRGRVPGRGSRTPAGRRRGG